MSQGLDGTDLPPGEWSGLLVGHQWPGPVTLSLLDASARRRADVHRAQENHAEVLRAIRTGNLNAQQGVTAEAAREVFRTGEQRLRVIAEKNLGKHASYQAGLRAASRLRADLAAIAADGNAAIRRAVDSDAPHAAKVAAVVAIVVDAQERSNARAAGCCAEVCAAITDVLARESAGQSAREFALAHGVDLPASFGSPVADRVHRDVARMVVPSEPGGS